MPSPKAGRSRARSTFRSDTDEEDHTQHEIEPGEPGPVAPDGPPPYAGPPPVPATKRLSDTEARTFGMLAHLAAFAGFAFPFGHILGPLLVWSLKKDEHPFVDDQGK